MIPSFVNRRRLYLYLLRNTSHLPLLLVKFIEVIEQSATIAEC